MKRILITFARSFLALEFARQLHGAGHEIYVADSIGCPISRFSNAVYKSFKVPSPRFHSEEYVHALLHIVKKEKIDLVLPIYEEISYISKARHLFPETCEIFCPSFDLYDELHNKWSFQRRMDSLGIKILKSALVHSNEDLENLKFATPFALKPCYSRASQNVKKVIPSCPIKNLPIDPHNPWMAQEWKEGNRFCTYTICHQGKAYAHGIYPVNYAIEGRSCLTFEAVHHPQIVRWIEDFVRKVNYTGQIAFDFIESQDQELYAIECNPRTTSGLLLFTTADHLDQALLKTTSHAIFPKDKARRQIAIGMLMYGWRKLALPNNHFLNYLKDLFTIKDVVFDKKDLKPFFYTPFVFTTILLNSKKYKLSIPAYYTYDHDWNGQPIYLT